MIKIRRSADRGHFNHGWLETSHTFSFAEYRDRNQMGFRSLRVINEDKVQPGRGFGTHSHADMEIITYVLSGAIAHKDSLGTGSTIVPGEVQRMSAGTGIQHSEFNASDKEWLHLLQIWILPKTKGRPPGYEQKTIAFTADDWALIASPHGDRGSVTVGSDAQLYAIRLAAGKQVTVPLRPGRYGWVQVAKGKATLEGEELSAGDGASLESEAGPGLTATTDCEILFFDLG
jgi:redox-sensitive bicupin YhaK (pirin superfamily)